MANRRPAPRPGGHKPPGRGPKPGGPARRPHPPRRPANQAAGPHRPRGKPPGPDDGLDRLQKVLAHAGIASRRACEDLIRQGRITVDGQVARELGTKVDPRTQQVAVDGQKVHSERNVYYAVHKPKGYVSTNNDPSGKPRVIDLLPEIPQRAYAVGRLDEQSTGLMLLTNDGELANKLAHPKFGVEKIYRVVVAGEPGRDILDQLTKGIWLAEGKVRAKRVRIVGHKGQASIMEMVLAEGKNREIRRMLAKLGHKVMSLTRIAVGPIGLKGIGVGECRPLTAREIELLHDVAAGRLVSAPSFPDRRDRIPRTSGPQQRSNRPPARTDDRPPAGGPRPAGPGHAPRLATNQGRGDGPNHGDRPGPGPQGQGGRPPYRPAQQGQGQRPPYRPAQAQGQGQRPPYRPAQQGEGQGQRPPYRPAQQGEGQGQGQRPPYRPAQQGEGQRPPYRPAQGQGQEQRPPYRPAQQGQGQGQGQRPPYRPAQQGQAQNQGQRPPYRPAQQGEGQGQGQRPPYRPAQQGEGQGQGQRPPYRPAQQGEGQGQRPPYRPAQQGEGQGQRPPYRPAQQGEGQGQRPPYRPAQQGEGQEQRPPYRPAQARGPQGHGPARRPGPTPPRPKRAAPAQPEAPTRRIIGMDSENGPRPGPPRLHRPGPKRAPRASLGMKRPPRRGEPADE